MVAVGHWVGILFFMIAFTVFMLFFIGCSISDLEKSYEKTKTSKDEIEANRALTTFLGMTVDEEKMPIYGERKNLDLIIESYSEKDYEEINELAKSYFNEDYSYWHLKIFSNKLVYDSIQYNRYKLRFVSEGEGSKAETKIIVKENEELTVSLFIIK